MSKKRVLFVTQEMQPYTEESAISSIMNQLAPYIYNKGYEIRVLMPKYGSINERRHRLHEVVRLSGMNIIVDDDDFPLIIKVASLPGSRMQVYFLDSEDFFKRKFIFHDEDGKVFDDNADRMIFFCKGVMETVKKFGWAPDIIHCHGWMTSLVPLYLDKIYNSDPIFENAKLIYSVYPEDLGDGFNESFYQKAAINDLEKDDMTDFQENGSIKLHYGAIKNAHGLISGSENLEADVKALIDEANVPVIQHSDEAYLDEYQNFYTSFIED